VKRSELVARLNELPDLEVQDEYGADVLSAEQSTYDDDEGTKDCIALRME
jgi:hypothetical protein